MIGAGFALYEQYNQGTEEIPLSKLASQIKDGQVEEITVEGEDITAKIEGEDKDRVTQKEANTALTETLSNYGVTPEMLSSIDTEINDPSGIGYWLATLGPFLLPLLLIAVFIWFLSRQVRGGGGAGGMQPFSFGESKAKMIDPEEPGDKITFDDVAGVKEAKQELREVVEFLSNPEKFIDIGAEIPKGVILMGEPGTGKTLLARAVAGEAQVPFFSISGSEFVEMFVGVGASRVRDMFEKAKDIAPAIIFIDEIDAIGRTRGSGVGGGNDEREQTLNQILTEMDGFEPNEKVIVMAATNRPDVLDPALLRPGRFDRRIRVDTPDINDREEILDIHAEEKPLTDDVDLRTLAERTPGFTGADLESLVNEAAIRAAQDDRKQVSQEDFISSIEKVMLGPERESHLLSDHEKKITAYHEAGHAVVSSVLEHADPVHKVSIISRGKAAGYTLNLPTEEKRFKTRREFVDELAYALGGYVTEQMIFDDITTGPANDIKRITKRARAMVTKYGMSDTLGPIAFEDDEGNPMYGRRAGDSKEYSQEVAAKIDEEVSQLISNAKKRAKKTITEHRDLLDEIANRLIENETIERDAFEAILRDHGVEVERDESDEEYKKEEQKTEASSKEGKTNADKDNSED
ncbi:MAG: cell division protein FtsH [Parcubacteria group bacterium SW_6_46_9]|nr:MAG: cell division protein FtsH [Parcubacteria group bacterium SW_6_46_9]